MKGDETASSDGRVKDEDIILSKFLGIKKRRKKKKEQKRRGEIARSRFNRGGNHELFSPRKPRASFLWGRPEKGRRKERKKQTPRKEEKRRLLEWMKKDQMTKRTTKKEFWRRMENREKKRRSVNQNQY